MKCDISVGEMLDKISILRIKRLKIVDEAKLCHVRKELAVLEAQVVDLPGCESIIQRLADVNLALWDTEDAIRRKEAAKQFDEEFIRLARSIYRTNDRRFEIKNEANCRFSSELQEQKSYDKY
jgi:hypothetical protein